MKKSLQVFLLAYFSWIICGSETSLGAKNPVQNFLKQDLPKNMGCGPGAVIFQRESVLSTILGTIVNTGFSPFLPFSSTSGTSGCSGGPAHFVENQPSYRFFLANYDTLLEEMAQGDGESLATFSSLMITSPSNRKTFQNVLKHRFESLFGDVTRSKFDIYLQIEQNHENWL